MDSIWGRGRPGALSRDHSARHAGRLRLVADAATQSEPGWFCAARAHIFPIMTASAHHHIFDTAIGPCGVAWNARGLTGVQLPEQDRAATERRLAAKANSAGAAEPPPSVAAVIDDIKRYLAGEPVDFAAVAVDLSGLDPYRQKLYASMRSLAW